MFGALYTQDDSTSGALIAVAHEFSPRVRIFLSGREVVLDLTGLARMFGSPRAIAEQLRRTAADRGLRVRVAIAGTQTAARLLVRHRAGLTVIEPGTEAEALAALPIATLADLSSGPNPPSPLRGFGEASDLIAFSRWGARTLGALAALPADGVAARLGQSGVRWQRAARGEDPGPLVPSAPEEPFEQALDLEWPIEGIEPLSFVLGRLLEPLSAHLEQRDRGAAVLRVRLHLVTRDVHERSLELPIPIREARTLRTLILLDLESHPPQAAIDRVVVAIDPTPARVVQFSLLTRPQPTPEQLSTLMARLHALMGETRCGSPAAVDSWEPGAFEMRPFMPQEVNHIRGSGFGIRDSGSGIQSMSVALRRFRLPIVARVRIEEGRPVRVVADRRGLVGGGVEQYAGPWRTSGAWWRAGNDSRNGGAGRASWDREEWDVTLTGGATYRVFRDRHADTWFIEGQID